MPKVYLGLGTNLGNKEDNLRLAINKLKEQIGEVISLSAFHHSEPWGFSSKNSFLNAALCIETDLTPQSVLEKTQAIEKEIGRKNKSIDGNYSDRLIDIDILLYDMLIIQTDALIIPHPLMTQRAFVMTPLSEIAPNFIHPEIGESLITISNKL